MTHPFLAVAPVPAAAFADIRRRAIFECCKWDPQMEDASAIASAPLMLTRSTWDELARLAERLAAETIAAETELLERPDLHARLALPWDVRRALRLAEPLGAPRGVARLMRFDFHFTTNGWRISEANTDVPGGLNEASGFAALFAPHFPESSPVGDPVVSYVDAIARSVGDGGRVALVHATAFTDDRQVMTYLARALRTRNVRCELASPSQLRWRDGRASFACDFSTGDVDAIVRFFPAEWLPQLSAATGWTQFFAGSRTPLSNPAIALLTQSKRFPLVWHELRTPLPAWRALLPETHALGDCEWRRDDWVLKPALGRVGEDVALRGAIPDTQMNTLRRAAWLRPRHWVAQRRFDCLPVAVAGAVTYPCVGVYTIDGRAAGAYGRVAPRPLIDWRAQDAAVLQTPEPC
jgi:glutathionylspermidine synthase